MRHTGISWNADTGKWDLWMQKVSRKKRILMGSYPSMEDAIAAKQAALNSDLGVRPPSYRLPAESVSVPVAKPRPQGTIFEIAAAELERLEKGK